MNVVIKEILDEIKNIFKEQNLKVVKIEDIKKDVEEKTWSWKVK